MNTVTDVYRVKEAVRYLDFNYKLWLGIGGSNLIWTDNSAPPMPSTAIQEIQDLSALIHIHNKKLVKPDAAGSIRTKLGTFAYASSYQDPKLLANEEAYYLLLEAYVPETSNIVNQNYKLIGLLENVQFIESPVHDKGIIELPDNVINYDLIWISTVSSRQVESGMTFSIIRRF